MVAKDEQPGATLIKIHVGGRLMAIDDDDDRAMYPTVSRLVARRPATQCEKAYSAARVLVEVQLQHGGIAPRALVGGSFNAGAGEDVLFEVLVGAPFDVVVGPQAEGGHPKVCPSRLWRRPFTAGLPEEFAPAVLRGLADGRCPARLPPGVLSLDRAGFDERESGTPSFELAGRMLRCILAEMLRGGDTEAVARRLIDTW